MSEMFDGVMREGTAMLLLDPFTPNERAVPMDSPEARDWLAAHPSPPAQPLTITAIDMEAKAVTLSNVRPESSGSQGFIYGLTIPEDLR